MPLLIRLLRHALIGLALSGLLLLPHLLLASEEGSIRFAPLPLHNRAATTIAFLPMVEYLAAKLGQPVELVYYDRHAEVLDAFSAGEIQLVYLGPLPYVVLAQRSQAVEPVVFFREATGLAQYRCALIAFADDVPALRTQTVMRVGLTQPLSTCGYLGGRAVLQRWRGLVLDELEYAYLGSHEQVALSVVAGEVAVGSVKDEFVQHFASLGIEVLAYSDWLPATGLFAHRDHLGTAKIAEIRSILLETPTQVYQTWGSSIGHGMAALSDQDLQALYALGDPSSIPEPPAGRDQR